MTARPILVASDLTSRLDRVIERCAMFGAPLLLVHVAGRSPPEPATCERLEALARGDRRDPAQVAEVEILHGSIPDAVTRYAQERDCGLIATGIASFDSAKDYLLGTTVDEIVQRSRQPVLVVKRKPRLAYENIVVATDFSPCSARAVRTAAALFPETGIRLLHACSPPFPMFLDPSEMGPFVRDQSESEMPALVAGFEPEIGSRIYSEVALASLEMLLDEHQVLGRCDLLVLGTRGRAGLARVVTGSRASELLTRSTCDVLMVRETPLCRCQCSQRPT
jgi:nucleotide-binding universal stress UspA family protein